MACYPSQYVFDKNIFYDVKIQPEQHMKAFHYITAFLQKGSSSFSCFPIRSTFIPCFMTLDSKILHKNVLKYKTNYAKDQKFKNWGRVVNLKDRAFKAQDHSKSVQFQGTVYTDGIGMCVLKQTDDTDRSSKKFSARNLDGVVEKTPYIEHLSKKQLAQTKGKCVLIDPGRRDILFCMKEDSLSGKKKKKTMTYTKMQRTWLSRHYRILRKKLKPRIVQAAEDRLSKTKSYSVTLSEFTHYIQTRGAVSKVLYPYYGNETETSLIQYFPGYQADFFIRQSHNHFDLYFGRLFISRLVDYQPIDPAQMTHKAKLKMYIYHLKLMLTSSHIMKRFTSLELKELNELVQLMTVENETTTLKRLHTILDRLHLLPFRKMKFSSKLYHDKDDMDLVARLRKKFGSEAVLVIGNWSAPNQKFQDPTRNKGLIEMLKKNGFTVYLIDEFRTSSVCPSCSSDLESKFKVVKNPRPFRRKKTPTVECHGLLRYD